MSEKDNALQRKLLLRKLTDEELADILAFDKLKRLNQTYPKIADPLIQVAKDYTSHINLKASTFSHSVLSTLMEAPSYPLIMLWCLVGIAVDMSFTMLAMICGAFGVFTLGVISVFAIGTHRELKREQEKKHDEIMLSALQRLCSEERLRRLSNNDNYMAKMHAECMATFQIKPKPDKKFLTRLKYAAEPSLIVSATLFTAYYTTIQSVLLSLGYAALAIQLATPIGIGVALGVSFGVGFFFGHKKYHSDKNDEVVNRQHKQIGKERDFYNERCEAFETAAEKKANMGLDRADVVAAVSTIHSKRGPVQMMTAAKPRPPLARGRMG